MIIGVLIVEVEFRKGMCSAHSAVIKSIQQFHNHKMQYTALNAELPIALATCSAILAEQNWKSMMVILSKMWILMIH